MQKHSQHRACDFFSASCRAAVRVPHAKGAASKCKTRCGTKQTTHLRVTWPLLCNLPNSRTHVQTSELQNLCDGWKVGGAGPWLHSWASPNEQLTTDSSPVAASLSWTRTTSDEGVHCPCLSRPAAKWHSALPGDSNYLSIDCPFSPTHSNVHARLGSVPPHQSPCHQTGDTLHV